MSTVSIVSPSSVHPEAMISATDPSFDLIGEIKTAGLRIVCIGAGYVGGPTMCVALGAPLRGRQRTAPGDPAEATGAAAGARAAVGATSQPGEAWGGRPPKRPLPA